MAASVVTTAAAVYVGATYSTYYREMKLARARLLADSTVLKTPDGDIEYAVEGDGPTVLSLHGAGGGYDQGLWAARLAFGSGHRVIAVSRYGYLRSPIPQNASIRKQAAVYRDLLDKLGVQKLIVLGISAGGPSAIEFANDYPERTAALILLSAVTQASATGDKPKFYIGVIHLIQRSDYAYWLVTRLMQPAILNLMGIPASAYAGFSPAQTGLARQMLETMHPMSERYLGTVNDGEMIGRQAVSTDAISAPTLVLHAKDDALVSYRHAEHARAVIRGSRLILFETGGHGLLSRLQEVRLAVRQGLNTMPRSAVLP